jgi:dihydrofolate reductase
MGWPAVHYHTPMSLDGYVAPPDGCQLWLRPFLDAASAEIEEALAMTGAFVMGRSTYEQEIANGSWRFGDYPTLVLTSHPIVNPPPGVEVRGGCPKAALDVLTSRMTKGDIWLYGGGYTAARFLDAGLIDNLWLAIVPVVLGGGWPPFDGANGPAGFVRKEVREGPKDLVYVHYERVKEEQPPVG